MAVGLPRKSQQTIHQANRRKNDVTSGSKLVDAELPEPERAHLRTSMSGQQSSIEMQHGSAKHGRYPKGVANGAKICQGVPKTSKTELGAKVLKGVAPIAKQNQNDQHKS